MSYTNSDLKVEKVKMGWPDCLARKMLSLGNPEELILGTHVHVEELDYKIVLTSTCICTPSYTYPFNTFLLGVTYTITVSGFYALRLELFCKPREPMSIIDKLLTPFPYQVPLPTCILICSMHLGIHYLLYSPNWFNIPEDLQV